MGSALDIRRGGKCPILSIFNLKMQKNTIFCVDSSETISGHQQKHKIFAEYGPARLFETTSGTPAGEQKKLETSLIFSNRSPTEPIVRD